MNKLLTGLKIAHDNMTQCSISTSKIMEVLIHEPCRVFNIGVYVCTAALFALMWTNLSNEDIKGGKGILLLDTVLMKHPF